MELKAKLEYPYTEEQRVNFIVEQNHRLSYEIRKVEREIQEEIIDPETEEIIEIITKTVIDLEAWGETEQEIFDMAKEQKVNENTLKAKEAVESGYVIFKEAQFETNSQTVGDLTATMLLMQAAGIETYNWLSKDDKVVELTLEDFATLGAAIAAYKNSIWNTKYLNYKTPIDEATTIEELEAIIIDYTTNNNEVV